MNVTIIQTMDETVNKLNNELSILHPPFLLLKYIIKDIIIQC